MATSNKKKQVKKKVDPVFECRSCGKFKTQKLFFISHNDLHTQGVIPYCKDCLKAMCQNEFGEFNKDRFLKVLRTIDKPYLQYYYDKCMEKGEESFLGRYLRTMQLTQLNKLTWAEGDLDKLNEEAQNLKPNVNDVKEVQPIETIIDKYEKFNINDDIIQLFGTGYTDEEYFQMNTKYQFLKQNYTESTSMHTEALITYVRYKVKEEMAVKNDKPNEAKTWGELAMKQAERAKLNPNQFNKADLQGGLSTMGEIAQAVEQTVNIIPILPRFKYSPQDAVDFCIWNYINYARKLEGKPKVEYSDVYAFYDKAKEEYIKTNGDPFGLFTGDTTTNNRNKIEQFLQMPEDYNESGDE